MLKSLFCVVVVFDALARPKPVPEKPVDSVSDVCDPVASATSSDPTPLCESCCTKELLYGPAVVTVSSMPVGEFAAARVRRDIVLTVNCANAGCARAKTKPMMPINVMKLVD